MNSWLIWTVGSATAFCKPRTRIYSRPRVRRSKREHRASGPPRGRAGEWKLTIFSTSEGLERAEIPTTEHLLNNYLASTPTPALSLRTKVSLTYSPSRHLARCLHPAPAPKTPEWESEQFQLMFRAANHGPDPTPRVSCGFAPPTPQPLHEMSIRGTEGH